MSKLKLPQDNESFVGKSAIVTGFGWNWVKLQYNEITHLNDEIGISREKLRFARTQVISKNACDSLYKVPIPKELLCAQVIQRKPNQPEGVCSVRLNFYVHKAIIIQK